MKKLASECCFVSLCTCLHTYTCTYYISKSIIDIILSVLDRLVPIKSSAENKLKSLSKVPTINTTKNLKFEWQFNKVGIFYFWQRGSKIFCSVYLFAAVKSVRLHWKRFRQQKKLGLRPGLPDFARYNIPKQENYTKWSGNITNGHQNYQMACKIDQTGIQYINIFHCKTLQKLPKLGFLVWK
jgi:hypothetical protein